MEKTLQDLCREAKTRLGMTNQSISDVSGVPISSVNNFFSAASKQPSVHTAACICGALGVSIDGFYGVIPRATPEEVRALVDELHEEKLRSTRLQGELNKNCALQKLYKKYSLVMFFMGAALIAYLLYRLFALDAAVPNMGVVLNGEATVGAWVLLGSVVAVVLFMAFMLFRIVKRGGNSDEPMPELPVRQELMR